MVSILVRKPPDLVSIFVVKKKSFGCQFRKASNRKYIDSGNHFLEIKVPISLP
jgi:hypothetical protein